MAWGSKHIYQIFFKHLVCISFSNLFFLLFFFVLFTPCLLGILTSYIHVAWFVSFLIYIRYFILFSYIVYMFFGLMQEASPPCLLGAFPLFLTFFFFFSIYCVHAFEFRARSTTPLSFGRFFFCLLTIFSSILLYCVHAYQNQCYMCTKISVIQWLAQVVDLFLGKIHLI